MDSISTAVGASTHEHQHQQEATTTTVREARNVKQARRQAVAAATGGGERMPRPQLDEALKCPRCDSSNTKFCYYNNYNTSQPRYFCKACCRYWTHGGTLRNVPVGGGCRKNKRRPSSSSSSSSSVNVQLQHLVPTFSTVQQDFPNVHPSMFMPTGFDLPKISHLPFAPLSLSSLAATPPPLASGAGMTMPSSFLDMILDNQGSGFFGPMNSGMETPPSGFGAAMHHGVVGDQAAEIGGEVAGTNQGGQ